MEVVRVQELPDGGSPGTIEEALRGEGLEPFRWGNGARYYYPSHCHDYHSVIVCIAGSITFHVGGTHMELRPGDRLDLPAGVEHAATVGANGVECLEATR